MTGQVAWTTRQLRGKKSKTCGVVAVLLLMFCVAVLCFKCKRCVAPVVGRQWSALSEKCNHHWPGTCLCTAAISIKQLGATTEWRTARSHVPHLKRLVQDDTRHRLTLPDQRTSELMLWGYAIDKQHRVMAWLGPAYSSEDPFAPEVRNWKSGTPVHTIPLPGMRFFDTWRIRPSLRPDPQLGEKLLLLGKEELIPQQPPNADYGQAERADIQHRREQEREARGAAKTTAKLALESVGHRKGRMPYVLTQLLSTKFQHAF